MFSNAQTNRQTIFHILSSSSDCSIVNNVLRLLEFYPYIWSEDVKVSVFAPTDKALQSYVDPVSYGMTQNGKPAYQLWEFGRDESERYSDRAVFVNVHKCVLNSDGSVSKGDRITQLKSIPMSYNAAGGSVTVLSDRALQILGDMIISGEIVPEKSFYKTMGNHIVKVDGNINVAGSMQVSGGWQLQRNYPSNVTEVKQADNGTLYVIDSPIMQSSKSVCMTLSEIPEFSEFFQMMNCCGIITPTDSKDSWTAGDQMFGNLMEYNPKTKSNYYLTYNNDYTIYVPTNDAMMKAYQMGLPTLMDLEIAETYDMEMAETKEEPSDSAEHIKSIMSDFVKYHIQHGAVFADNGFNGSKYDTKQLQTIPSVDGEGITTGKYIVGAPYTLTVNASKSGINVTDNMGRTANVITKEGLYNKIACEYWYNGNHVSQPVASTIQQSANVAVHAIDSPLLYNYHAGSLDPDYNQFVYKNRSLTNE